MTDTERLRALLAAANEGPLPAHAEAALAWAAVNALPDLLRDRERLAVLEGALDEFLTPIEGGFAHWEHDHPVTGEHLSGDPKVVILDRETWLPKTVALRAALKGATS